MDADLVLEGGGVKGIALVGAIQVLEERGYTFHRVAGTSAGSIVGALVAANITGTEMVRLMRQLDYRKFQDEGLEDKIPLLGPVLSAIAQKGIYEGKFLKSWLAALLDEHGVRTFGDLRLADADSSLSPEQQYRLVVMASDVSTGRLRRLPWDYPRLGYEDPSSIDVVDAVRASMSIPFFFEPVRLRNRATDEDLWLVDGGMLSNFPVEVFDRRDGRSPRWPTFGIKLSARRGEQATRFRVDGPVSLVKAMVGTMTGFHDQMHIDDPSVVARTIFVDTSGISSTDFGLNDKQADVLYRSGRTAAEKFLATWDFAAYKDQFRTSAIPAARRADESDFDGVDADPVAVEHAGTRRDNVTGEMPAARIPGQSTSAGVPT